MPSQVHGCCAKCGCGGGTVGGGSGAGGPLFGLCGKNC